jgi:hypothetical protein
MPAPDRANDKPACVGHNDTPIFPGNVVSTPGLVTLQFDRSQSKERDKLQKALQASKREAAMGSSSEEGGTYMPELASVDDTDEEGSSLDAQQLTARVRTASQSLIIYGKHRRCCDAH